MNGKTAYDILMKKGKADLRVSEKLLHYAEPEYDIICFHIQQFIEKYLKAFLIKSGTEPPKVHDINMLLRECIRKEKEFERFRINTFTQFSDCGVMIRYDDLEDIDRKFIEESLSLISEFKIFVEEKLSYL
jgi:HEPN domain-containing protein